MHAKLPHPFDDATRISAGDSSWQGHTSDDYWAFVGPFGGATAATILRALIDHPQRAGDPLALTVNYCAPIAKGPFDLDVRLVKANRSSQHWSVELSQGGGEVATLATAVFAERRPSWEHRVAQYPDATAFEATLPFPKISASAQTCSRRYRPCCQSEHGQGRTQWRRERCEPPGRTLQWLDDGESPP